MSYSPRSRRGHAQVPGSFVRGTSQVQCGPDQYRFGNMFGGGCTYREQDERRLALQFHPEQRARRGLEAAAGRARGAAERLRGVGQFNGNNQYQYPYAYDGLTPGQRRRVLTQLGQPFYGTRDVAYGNVSGAPVGGTFHHDGLYASNDDDDYDTYDDDDDYDDGENFEDDEY
jgi:hypothetical protein